MELDRIIAVRTGKTVYRDGENCIKVFENGYPKDDVLSEALNHARVETTGLNMPAVKAVTQIDGKWAIVTEYIHGKTLDCLMSENHDRRHEYLGKFVDLQLEAFSKTCPLLVSLTEKMRDRIAKTNLGDDVKTELLKRLEELPRHHKLCHGDFNPTNIIVSDDGKPYILDWSHATIGNASADVARTYLLFWLNGDISGAEEYMDLFCEKSGTSRDYAEKWLPIVAAAQSVKGNVKTREFLLSYVNGVFA